MTDLREPDNDGKSVMAVEAARPWYKNALPVAVMLLLFNVTVFVSAPIASRAFGIAFLLVVPGTVLMSLTPIRPTEISVRLTLSLGASMLLLMLLGLFYSLVLPHVGVVRPLSRTSVLIGVDVMIALGLAVQMRVRDPLNYFFRGGSPSWNMLSTAGILSLLPLGAVIGAERLNNNHGGEVALSVLITVGVVLCGLVVYAERMPRWTIGMVIYSASAAVLLMASMRSNFPIGSDIQSEFYVMTETLRSGIWHLPAKGNPYAAMLSITVLPVSISLVTHATGIYLFKLVYPLIFSLFSVMVYVASVRWFPTRAAVVGAIVLIVQGFYSADMTGLARQEIALVYFALLVVVAFDESIARRPRQVAAVVAGLGMAISHYSTAYFTSAILVIGFGIQLIFRLTGRWRSRWRILLTLPVVVGIVGVVVLWNVVITRSAQNVVGLATSVEANGFQFLPGSAGSSLISRFLKSDVNPTVSATKITSLALPYYRSHDSFIHPYPASISNLFPLKSVTPPNARSSVPASYGVFVNNAGALLSELLLLAIVVGIVVFLWRQRKSVRGERSEFGFVAVGCIILLAVLRLSGTVSTLYNAPRGQVQGAPLLSIGLACVCAWMFTGRLVKRFVFIGGTTLCLALLFFSDSTLSGLALGGGATDTLMNYGGAYESYYFTESDIDSAKWIAQHDVKGQVIFADDYGSLQLDEVANLTGIIPTIIPRVIEPGAFVYADSTNIVDKTAYANLNNTYSIYQFPVAFLNHVKNVVFSTGTTAVYR